MTLELIERTPLDELAATANDEHRQVSRALRASLRHAIAAGEALTQARDQLDLSRTRDVKGRYVNDDGVSWPDWCRDNLAFHTTTANWYVRIYRYRSELEAADVDSFKGAMRFLRQQELRVRETLTSDDVKDLFVLYRAKVPQTEIAKRMGVSKQTVNHYVRRRVRRKPTPRWLTHRRRRTGSKWDRPYGYFRQTLDALNDVAPNADRRYDELYQHLYWIEDFFGKQMRTGR